MKFIHTADWQIGKPFAGISDMRKRSLVQHARVEAIKRIGLVAKDNSAEFVLVAGDLFDSSSADKSTVSAACSAIGKMEVPVFAIPGNHDHGGVGSVWEQEFFQREHVALAPNLTILINTAPVELESAVLLPCPLMRRAVSVDPTEWLRYSEVYAGLPPNKPRIVLAHGSTHSFSSVSDEDSRDQSSANLIGIDRLPEAEIDYAALGDWHGTRQVDPKSWYSGTPEFDRFSKGGDHDQGNVLIVEVKRSKLPQVTRFATASLNWTELTFDFADDAALADLEARLKSRLGQRANEDLLRLSLTGSIGIEASNRLQQMLEALDARLLRVKLVDQTLIAPTGAEIQALTERGGDPLIANVARQLLERCVGQAEDAQVARIALRELHAACSQESLS